ncbi:MAG: twin-arginine translocase subunit TatC [Humidesulfovibrio sp.]|nr:twin-arginine translocase subunit TatC [Humidesulfovibrio sp.]
MFGTGELLLIALVAIIVVDPKKLPDLMKGLGKALAEFKQMSSEFKSTIERETEAADFEKRKAEAHEQLYGSGAQGSDQTAAEAAAETTGEQAATGPAGEPAGEPTGESEHEFQPEEYPEQPPVERAPADSETAPEAPAEAQAEAPLTSAPVSAEPVAEAPVESPAVVSSALASEAAEARIEAPAEVPAESAAAPAEVSAEMPAETPADAPAVSSAEPPAAITESSAPAVVVEAAPPAAVEETTPPAVVAEAAPPAVGGDVPPPPPPTGDDAVGESQSGRMSLFGHLQDLRKRLTRSAIAMVVGFLACYAFAGQMLKMLMQPMLNALKQSHFIYTVPTEAFFTEMKVAFVAGIFAASPYIFYQIFQFISPGLYSHEKRWIIPIAFFSALCFTTGALFGYFVVFPFGFEFFASYASDILLFTPKLDEYLDFVLKLLFAFGIVFELPLFLFFLARLGIVGHVGLRKKRKYAVLVAFVLAAALTPPDAVSQTMMAVPLIILYEVGIWLAYFFGKKKKPAPEEAAPTETAGA